MTAVSDRSNTAGEPSDWQKKIAGEWHGRPGLFDPEGNHVGYERIARASEVLPDGTTVYWMNGTLDGSGPLRNRFQLGADFRFEVIDSDENRVYMGPDFYGTGQPYGLFVDAHYYSPGWQADLRTWNQVLPDGKTQVYSSVLHDGWSVCAVFNGLYKVVDVGANDQETQGFIDSWIRDETDRAPRPHVLPTKQKGAWTGTLEVYDAASQEKVGDNFVTIDHEPLSLVRTKQTITWEGAINRKYSFERLRRDQNTTYDGPDIMGNARNYGRALFTSQHFTGGDVWKIKGREYLLDDSQSLSIVWEAFKGDMLTNVIFGQLDWKAQA